MNSCQTIQNDIEEVLLLRSHLLLPDVLFLLQVVALLVCPTPPGLGGVLGEGPPHRTDDTVASDGAVGQDGDGLLASLRFFDILVYLFKFDFI